MEITDGSLRSARLDESFYRRLTLADSWNEVIAQCRLTMDVLSPVRVITQVGTGWGTNERFPIPNEDQDHAVGVLASNNVTVDVLRISAARGWASRKSAFFAGYLCNDTNDVLR